MAQTGDQIENPVTGERITFLRTAADTSGELLELELIWPRQGQRVREHVHPEMEERFVVLAGTARFRLDGVERDATAGEVVAVPPGTPHLTWNPTTAETRVRVEFRPALRWEEFVERLFALPREGRTDELGMPEPDALRALMREFRREIAPAPRSSGGAQAV